MHMSSVLLRYHCYCDTSTAVRDHTKEAPNHFPTYINIDSAKRMLL